jgi:hypothetical protein
LRDGVQSAGGQLSVPRKRGRVDACDGCGEVVIVACLDEAPTSALIGDALPYSG